MRHLVSFGITILAIACLGSGMAHPTPPGGPIHYRFSAPLPYERSGRRHIMGAPAIALPEPPAGDDGLDFRAALPPRSQTSASRSRLVPVPPPGTPPWMHGLQAPEIPFRWNEQLVAYLKFYHDTARGRAHLKAWFRRMTRYEDTIKAFLRAARLPEDLIYVAMIESGFRNDCVSRAGAVGMWQFMKHGARIYGLRIDYWLDERRDPIRSTLAAILYLSDLWHRFGNWPLALAAFNAGYGAVLRSIKTFNTNDYWALSRFESGLPYATTHYVPKFFAVAIAGHNRAEFGLDEVKVLPPFTYETVVVRHPLSLRRVARLAGVSLDAIRTLNPALKRRRIPPGFASFELRLPTGSKARFLANYARMRHFRYAVHRLRWGETLADVAAEYGTTVGSLRRLNGIRSIYELRAGTLLLVPRHRGRAAGPRIRPLVAVPRFGRPADENMVLRYYRVCPGDSLSALAKLFGVKLRDLTSWNLVDPTAKLVPGMFLRLFLPKATRFPHVRLYGPEDVDVVQVDTADFRRATLGRRGLVRIVYRARRGDSIRRLARRFRLSVGSIVRINKFGRKHTLHPGDQVVLYVRPKLLARLGLGHLVAWEAQPPSRRRRPRIPPGQTGKPQNSAGPGRPRSKESTRPAQPPKAAGDRREPGSRPSARTRDRQRPSRPAAHTSARVEAVPQSALRPVRKARKSTTSGRKRHRTKPARRHGKP